MFGCCCANKKALKNKEQQKNADARVVVEVAEGENDGKKSPLETPQKIISSATDAPMSPVSDMSGGGVMRHENNDKSNSSSSEEGNNNLSGLIMSDGLVGESCY